MDAPRIGFDLRGFMGKVSQVGAKRAALDATGDILKLGLKATGLEDFTGLIDEAFKQKPGRRKIK